MATETYKVIAQRSPAAATLETLYTVPASTQAVLSTIIVANRSGTKTNYRIAVSPAGAAVSNEHYIAYDTEILGNDSHEITLGITLSATDVIRVYATLATLSFNAFGVQVT